ncbi:MAG TPA: DUF2889 domain-containing protein [Rhodospirillales bacterium]|nr:DUF2889 domain-containing protein [Rhodospirillales bacterium]
MPLSRPAPREHIHSREIRCRGFRRADGMWDVEGVLEDTKTYSFANHDRDGIVSGEPIHRMHVRLTVDDALVVQAAEAFTEAAPFSLCGDIAPAFAGLVGLRVGPVGLHTTVWTHLTGDETEGGFTVGLGYSLRDFKSPGDVAKERAEEELRSRGLPLP